MTTQKKLGVEGHREQYNLKDFKYAEVEKEIWEEIGSVQLRVLAVLESSELARDSYAVLVSRYWQKEVENKGLQKTPFMMTDSEIQKHLKSPESITRAYRKLQEMEGVQFASDETQEERDRREKGFEKAMGKNKGANEGLMWDGGRVE